MKYFRMLQAVFCLFTLPLIAQPALAPTHQKIATSLQNYFAMDRENIHLHLNKTVYLSNEQIWFKGYIVEKKNKPTFSTSNVFITLADHEGKKLSSQLYYAENNLFEGRIPLDKKIASGKYYLQVYTNYMNNFLVDESSVFEITVLNIADKGFVIQNDINYEEINVAFFPESGIFLKGISNTIGIKIADCNGRGIAVNDANIIDNQGNVISTFSSDPFGYGKFEIYSTNYENYKVVFSVNGKKITKLLPLPSMTGIAFSIDNYITPNKTIVKVKTNPETLQQIKNKPYTFVFQQNETAAFAEFSFMENTSEQVLTIPSTELNHGINAVFLVDSDLKKIGSRMIYKPSETTTAATFKIDKVRNDSIVISGFSTLPLANISLSVVPSQTTAEEGLKTIQTSLLFDNYLSTRLKNTDYYLKDFTRKKHYDLDKFLLTQNPKYEWNDMLTTVPTVKFESDAGLTVKGTVNTDIPVNKIFKINMNSLGLGLNEFTSLNKKNEFEFKHLIALDSTKIYFLVKDQNGKNTNHKLAYQVFNNHRKFLKPITFNPSGCLKVNSDFSQDKYIPFPKFDNAIMLDSINIVAKKNKLTYQKRLGNIMARGYKISDQDRNSKMDVLRFIANNGYTVSTLRGEVKINASMGNPGGRDFGPAILIDDMQIPNYDLLLGYSLDQVDEIYINKHNNASHTNGVIKIYTRKNYGIYNNNITDKSPVLIVKNGFQRFHPYENPKYDNMQDEGYRKFGTIDWKPFILSDEKGTFQFTIPNFYQKSVKIIVEGINADGQMISETQTLNLP